MYDHPGYGQEIAVRVFVRGKRFLQGLLLFLRYIFALFCALFRSVVVVRASAEESRRAVLSGLLAGAVALTAGAANAGDLVDDRKAYQNDFERIYEARDADLPQAVRDGLSQVGHSCCWDMDVLIGRA